MAVCIGDGLIESGGDVLVAVSGAWGVAPLDGYGATDTYGAPVYCDEAGELRTVPEHDASVVNVSGSSGVNASFGGATVATGPTVLATITNPSAVRPAVVLVVVTVKWQVAITAAPIALYAAYAWDGGSGDIAKTLGFPGAYTTEDLMSEGFTAELTAGESLTMSITPRVEAGGGSGNFLAQGVGIRAIIVTSTP